jgi:hypothetical protein
VLKNLKLQRLTASPVGGAPILNVTVVRRGANTFVYGSAGFPGKGIRGFRLRPNGSLEELPGSPFAPTGGRYSAGRVAGDLLVAVQAGEFVINQGGAIATFRIQADGALAAGPRWAYDPDVFCPVLARNGRCVFLPEINNRRLLAYGLDPAGALTGVPGSPFAVDPALAGTSSQGGILGMVTRGDLALLFNARPADGRAVVQAARVQADCTLAPLGNLQQLGNVAPVLLAIDPKQKCVVMADQKSIRSFRLYRNTGLLKRGNTRPVGAANLEGITIGER